MTKDELKLLKDHVLDLYKKADAKFIMKWDDETTPLEVASALLQVIAYPQYQDLRSKGVISHPDNLLKSLMCEISSFPPMCREIEDEMILARGFF